MEEIKRESLSEMMHRTNQPSEFDNETTEAQAASHVVEVTAASAVSNVTAASVEPVEPMKVSISNAPPCWIMFEYPGHVSLSF